MRAAGLCHTDIDVLHGRYGTGAFPLVPGHEYAGTIEAVAEDVTSVKPGDRVAVDPNIPCGQCPACAKGLTNLCSALKAYGVTENGGFAEYGVVAADHVHRIGDLAFETAALAEPLACVLNGLGAAGVGAGGHVPGNALIFGAGPIGLLMALSLKASGAAKVAVADISEQRLAFAASLGLVPLVSGSQDLAAQARGFDFVVDVAGLPPPLSKNGSTSSSGTRWLTSLAMVPSSRLSISSACGMLRFSECDPASLIWRRKISNGATAILASGAQTPKISAVPPSAVKPIMPSTTLAMPVAMKVQFSAES